MCSVRIPCYRLMKFISLSICPLFSSLSFYLCIFLSIYPFAYLSNRAFCSRTYAVPATKSSQCAAPSVHLGLSKVQRLPRFLQCAVPLTTSTPHLPRKHKSRKAQQNRLCRWARLRELRAVSDQASGQLSSTRKSLTTLVLQQLPSIMSGRFLRSVSWQTKVSLNHPKKGSNAKNRPLFCLLG